MFENLLEQDSLKGRLIHDIKTKSLPSSIIFYGPSYSGKMTAALELARTITCSTDDAPWNCQCNSCQSHRLMENPYTILTGGRYFYEEISASAELLRKNDELVFRYMFIRNIRKLLKRFDPLLWDGETNKLKKFQPLLTSVTEKTEEFLPGNELSNEKKKLKLLDALLNDCKKLASSAPGSTPINQIRKISTWAHRGGDKKVVILENADHMQDGARNALLKILEEPPEDLQFILITTRIGAILPTIKSRVRAYGFSGRSESESSNILKRIFKRQDNEFASMRDFFLSHHDMDYSEIREKAKLFIQSTKDGQKSFNEIITGKFEKEMFIPFLEELTILLNKSLKEAMLVRYNVAVSRKIEKWSKKIRDYSQQFDILNQSHTLLLESLFYEMQG